MSSLEQSDLQRRFFEDQRFFGGAKESLIEGEGQVKNLSKEMVSSRSCIAQ